MNVTVRLYAGLREAAGTPELTVAVDGEDLGAVRAAIAIACPAIAGQLRFCRFALDDDFVPDDVRIASGATIDVIPPVSGG